MELDELKIATVKNRILEYERQFKLDHNRKPSKGDIQQDQKILNYYKVYWKCKSSPTSATIRIKSTSPSAPLESTHVKPPEECGPPPSSNVAPRVWSSALNKKPRSLTTGDEDLDKFHMVSTKVQRLNEDYYREEAKTNKQLCYSLRYKRQYLAIKSKEVASQIKVAKSVKEDITNNKDQTHPLENSDKSNHVSIIIPEFFDLSITNSTTKSNQNGSMSSPTISPSIEKPAQFTALSLLESLATGAAPTTANKSHFENNDLDTFEFGNDFALDNLNEYIKDSIISDALDGQQHKSNNAQPKKRIFDIEDDGIFDSRKRFCTAQMYQSATDSSNDSNDVRLSNQPNESISNPSNETTANRERKFFKSRQNRAVYGPQHFFDHNKDDEFEFSDNSNDKDQIYTVEDSGKPNTPKLANVTNKKLDKTQKTEKSKAKITTKKVKEKANFQKLNMKKKVFARGSKKFNMKQYKYKSWKSNKKFGKRDNKCFKCGESDHWANACPHISSVQTTQEEKLIESGLENECIDQTFDACIDAPLFNDVDDPELDQLVEETLTLFGFESFRPNQKITIKRILCSKSTLLISPTGWGKSLCYQMAAYCFWKRRGLITLVVSPLISLMQDQIANFPSPLKAVSINSNKSDKEKEAAINSIMYGQAQVLFLSPECVVSGLNSINFNAFARVAFVCIDEAHCLAEWSTNFRPSYLHLYKVLRYKLNIKTLLAMTATVTKETSRIICRNLNLDPISDVIGGTKVPENLILTISKKCNKVAALIELLKSKPFCDLKSIIIYCTKRQQTTQLETQVRTLLQFDMPEAKVNKLIRAYHAGLGPYERTQIQKQFLSGKLRIVVATIAFGMGIDKPDIRGIIHFNMPKSFENYIQEIGRAGRDGAPAYCHLFLDNDGEDLFGLQNYIYANGVDKPNLRRLVSKIYQPCKCNQVVNNSEDSPSASVHTEPQTCSGHPVAVPIASTELEIDLKSESIYTLLMALEMEWPAAPIQMCEPMNSSCTIVNFGDENDMNELVKRSPIVQLGAALAKQESKGSFDFSNFKFSVVRVASVLGMEVNKVRSELRSLEWTTNPSTGRKKKSHVSIRFGDYSYLVRAPGTLSEEDIEEVTNFLYDTIEQYETKEIYKVRYLYCKFNEFVLTDANSALIESNSTGLKHVINDYFQLESVIGEPTNDSSKLNLPFHFDLQNQDLAAISLVICEFLHFHQGEGVNTPRKVARILQGISSPKYPAEIWGKVRKYWRTQTSIDFKHLLELCRRELMNSYAMLKASTSKSKD